MIRSFKDKQKAKQEKYEAKQRVLAEQAEQARIKREWELFDLEQEKIKQQSQQILAEEEQYQKNEYLEWKQEQDIIKEQLTQQPPEKNNTGIGIGHQDTWVLTWKSFSTHPSIIDLPMSEKIRLFKISERQQIDRLNYYANLFSEQNSLGSGHDWEDGVLDQTVTIHATENIIVQNSLDINQQLTIEAGAFFEVNGILTVNASITNRGTLIVNGAIVFQENIITEGDGIVLIN